MREIHQKVGIQTVGKTKKLQERGKSWRTQVLEKQSWTFLGKQYKLEKERWEERRGRGEGAGGRVGRTHGRELGKLGVKQRGVKQVGGTQKVGEKDTRSRRNTKCWRGVAGREREVGELVMMTSCCPFFPCES